MRARTTIVLVLGILATGNVFAQSGLTSAEWREDLQVLSTQMTILHPNLFFAISQAEFETAVAELDRAIPSLTDNQVVSELHKIAALPSRFGRDGHTRLSSFDPAFEFYLPVQFYVFEDGLFVLDATSAYQDLIGLRVVRIGKRSVEEAFAALDPLISRDNEATVLERLPENLMNPALLDGVDVIDGDEQIPVELERADGPRFSVSVTPISVVELVNWIDGRDSFQIARTPLYLSRPEENFWMTLLADSGTLYIQYNSVQSVTESGQTMEAFAEQVSTVISGSVERVVVDVRLNGGGDATTYEPLLRTLEESSTVNQRGRLFALTGRATFSAAGNFVTELQNRTEVLLVGEATGGGPNQYGDAQAVPLPNSGFTARVSTLYHQKSTADDPRITHKPDVRAPLSSREFFAGEDPVLQAAIEYEEGSTN